MERHLIDYTGIAKVLVLSRREIEESFSMNEALKVVEYALRLEAEGKCIMPPKLYLDLPEYHGDFRAMPAYIDGSAGIKWVCVYPGNKERGLSTVMATIILNDPGNGCPLAIMDGTYITNMRTGASGGVAVKYLARKDSCVIGMIGAGKQAETQLLAVNEVLPRIKEVKVFDKFSEASSRYVNKMRAKLDINIRAVRTIQEAAEADVVITTTPSTKPIIRRQDIKPGTHINAIGADAKGKQELEVELLKSAKIFVDDIEQACHSGELNVPLSENLMTVDDICGTLAEVVAGVKIGRDNDKDITIFDSTGLAIHDIICAKSLYEKVKGKGFPAVELF